MAENFAAFQREFPVALVITMVAVCEIDVQCDGFCDLEEM